MITITTTTGIATTITIPTRGIVTIPVITTQTGTTLHHHRVTRGAAGSTLN
jgi:hypothetical protein